MTTTVYEEAQPTDAAVAAFIAAHPYDVNLLHLPLKVWVARSGPDAKDISVVLMLNNHPYLALDLIVAKPETRPFMRILKLWTLAEDWLKAHHVPVICATIGDHLVHFQSLVKRYGFVEAAYEVNRNGDRAETVFIKSLQEGAADGHSSHTTH